jgi:hypothetical protein
MKARRLGSSDTCSRKLVEQFLPLLQISCLEAFGEFTSIELCSAGDLEPTGSERSAI